MENAPSSHSETLEKDSPEVESSNEWGRDPDTLQEIARSVDVILSTTEQEIIEDVEMHEDNAQRQLEQIAKNEKELVLEWQRATQAEDILQSLDEDATYEEALHAMSQLDTSLTGIAELVDSNGRLNAGLDSILARYEGSMANKADKLQDLQEKYGTFLESAIVDKVGPAGHPGYEEAEIVVTRLGSMRYTTSNIIKSRVGVLRDQADLVRARTDNVSEATATLLQTVRRNHARLELAGDTMSVLRTKSELASLFNRAAYAVTAK